MAGLLSQDQLYKIDAWWRAANYLSVGQIYLYDNPLLKEPLRPEHIKPRLLGHWGTTPGLNFCYVHLNRIIHQYDQDMIYIIGPGHGGPGIVANTYLEGTYSEVYPNVSQDERGLKILFKQFSFPGGIPSHVAPEVPGSIHEGGELGYSLTHAYGAVFDNPGLIAACIVGDGEAETGALAASWHSNKFLDPVHDGAVLPILHLNGYKIANPTVLARIPREELEQLMRGYGYKPYFVEGSDPATMHGPMAETLDKVVGEIHQIQAEARTSGFKQRPIWPMIVLKTPKGWTGPKEVDGQKTEDYWRSHQVPMGEMDKPEHIQILERWMRSYKPEELFDQTGTFRSDLREIAPKGDRRMSANPHANGGVLLRDLRMPDFREYAVKVPKPGAVEAEATRVMGTLLRDVMKSNAETRNFRLFGPDETNSNRLGAVFDYTQRQFDAQILPYDDHLAPDGRVIEVLSEHLCQGWLEGYLLTGRHGVFNCYEAFIHIIDSMFNQHAKWLKVTRTLGWRRPIASLNYLLSSHVWRQDHNGFSHQDPGFIDHVVNKKAEIIRVYLPPDANCLLSVTDHCLRSRNYVNVIVAGKQPAPQWLDMDAAIRHCTAGLSIWDWASNDQGSEPDVVMACCGDVPTLETLAAVSILREQIPDLKVRVINIVDLMKLQTPERASARSAGQGIRHDVHAGQAGHLRLPRLPVADPPADLPAHEPRQPARARLQGGRHHQHAVRHGGHERPGPLPPGDGRDRPRAEAGAEGRVRRPDAAGQADRPQELRLPVWPGHAGDPQLEVGRHCHARHHGAADGADGVKTGANDAIDSATRNRIAWGPSPSAPRRSGWRCPVRVLGLSLAEAVRGEEVNLRVTVLPCVGRQASLSAATLGEERLGVPVHVGGHLRQEAADLVAAADVDAVPADLQRARVERSLQRREHRDVDPQLRQIVDGDRTIHETRVVASLASHLLYGPRQRACRPKRADAAAEAPVHPQRNERAGVSQVGPVGIFDRRGGPCPDLVFNRLASQLEQSAFYDMVHGTRPCAVDSASHDGLATGTNVPRQAR